MDDSRVAEVVARAPHAKVHVPGLARARDTYATPMGRANEGEY